jgi:hypothetical protein
MFENDHFQDGFFSAETTMHCKVTCILFKKQAQVSSYVYKYDQWPHDSYMTGRAGVWEADDIVKKISSYFINEVNF